MTPTPANPYRPLAHRVAGSDLLPGVQLFSMKTDIMDVVTIQGSLLGGDVFSPPANSMVAEMTAGMLDQGSTLHDKFTISERLEEVGASLTFSAGAYRVRFGGRCLSGDVPLVIELLAEQLRYPAVNRGDLMSAKKREIGELKKVGEDTGSRAMEAFLQTVYPENHPNYFIPFPRRVADTENVEPKDIKVFHKKNYGRGHLNIVAVGDVDQKSLEKSVAQSFSGWQESPLSVRHDEAAKAKELQGPHTSVVTMAGKTSANLIIGQPMGIDREHDDFIPLMIGQFILGGNFSARLMTKVRDEQGLTYGIGSGISGADNGNDGFWYITGTYAPELIKKGREATVKELKRWISAGVTIEELEAKKSTITGGYKVSLATTRGLAGQILVTIERGKNLDYLDQYPHDIKRVSLAQVNRAIQKYCHMSKLVTVAAGSIDARWRPME